MTKQFFFTVIWFLLAFSTGNAETYLQQQIVTKHGVSADCWTLNRLTTTHYKVLNQLTEKKEKLYRVTGGLALYVNASAMEDEMLPLDQCVYTYSDIKKAEIKELEAYIIERLQESRLDSGNETNVLKCNSGMVGFQQSIVMDTETANKKKMN